MPYIIKKTDGNIVATVSDGTVDKSSSSITLIGKNYKGIGEIYNTNLVHLLENFSNSSPPNNQIKGQLWFNTSSSKLNVYDGSSWRPVGSPFVGNSRPGNLVQGDLWIDNGTQQLKFYDGSNLITAGPIYTVSQGKTGWVVEEIQDSRGNSIIVASMYLANIRMAILNATAFVPLLPIDGFTTGITPLKAGLTFSTSVVDNTINSASQSALALIEPVSGDELNSTKFVRSDRSGNIAGGLTLTGASGITLGPSSNIQIYVNTSGSLDTHYSVLSNNVSNSKLVLQTRGSTGFQDSFVIEPATKKVSVYPSDTWASLGGTTPEFVVNGDTTIQGSLTVVGETQFTNSSTLQVSDKNIELAVVDTPSNNTADGAGITVLGGTNNNKTITWLKAGLTLQQSPLITAPTWEVNDNFKIPSTNALYIGNSNVLNSTTLGNSIVNSSLTSVGTLVNLDVANFNFTNNVISITDPNENLEINVDPTGIIELTNRVRISNVAEPSLQFDVANKDYVDRVKTSINYLTVDITGITDPGTTNDVVIAQIEALIPAVTVNQNDVVRALCLNYDVAGTPEKVVKVFYCGLVQGIGRAWLYQTDVIV